MNIINKEMIKNEMRIIVIKKVRASSLYSKIVGLNILENLNIILILNNKPHLLKMVDPKRIP